MNPEEQPIPKFSEIHDKELAEHIAAKASTVGKFATWPEMQPSSSAEPTPAAPADQQ